MKHCYNSEKRKGGVPYTRVKRECVSDVGELIARHGPGREGKYGGLIRPDRVDLLQIDVEGHDFDVIQGIDFDVMGPRCIHYEADKPGVREKSVPFLEIRGYTIKKSTRVDVLACIVRVAHPDVGVTTSAHNMTATLVKL